VKRVPESNSGLKRRLSFAQHLAKLEEVLPTKPQERSKGMEMIKRFARRGLATFNIKLDSNPHHHRECFAFESRGVPGTRFRALKLAE
jgi:hypothetical protein